MIFVFKVEFPEEVYIEKIEVYETSDPGSITKLGVWNGHSYVTVYSGEVQFTSTQATIFCTIIHGMNVNLLHSL